MASLEPVATIPAERYLLLSGGLGVATMVALSNGPLARWSPPYEELTLQTPALGGVILVPLLLFGVGTISSIWLARRPPLRRSRWQFWTISGLYILGSAAIVAIGVVFLVVFADFNFEVHSLGWGFYVSLMLGAVSGGAAIAGSASWARLSRESPPASEDTEAER